METAGKELGQFAPVTPAEVELERMLQGPDERMDLALANWLIADGVPELSGMTREAFLSQIDAMTGHVRQEMDRRLKVAQSKGKDVSDPDVRCSVFGGAIISLKFAYAEEFRGGQLTPELVNALHANPRNTFLLGLLQTRRGSCVSMPLLYLVIGTRLGLPVHLVTVGQHYFIRWEEPSYRMNIETTIVDRLAVTPDDSVYLEREGLSREQIQGCALRNMTRREVVGNLFFTRSSYSQQHRRRDAHAHAQFIVDLARASHLVPDDAMFVAKSRDVLRHYRITPEVTYAMILQAFLSYQEQKDRKVLKEP